MENRSLENVDRISELPEPILHDIISFLPLREAAATSRLSKRWEQVWRTFSTFKLIDRFNINRNKRILEYLLETLRKRHMERISIQKFELDIGLSNDSDLSIDSSISKLVDECVHYAIEGNVKSLKLSFPSGFYNLRQIIFSAKSVRALRFYKCKLEPLRINVDLSSLRKLELARVVADDHIIENLVAGCPLIERLDLGFCRGLKSLDLPSLGKLREVWLNDNDELERLKISGLNVQEVHIDSSSSSCEISVAPCKNLKCLHLSWLYITDQWLCNEISKFPRLEILDIGQCENLERIKISSTSLNILLIEDCSKLIEVRIETPNLSIFTYVGDLISFSSNDLALSEANLHFYTDSINTEWFVRYIKLLAKFYQFSRVLNLTSNAGENVIIPREVRQSQCPPLSGVNQLKFTIDSGVGFPISELLDGLLWISPHVETIKIEYLLANLVESSIQLSYKKQPTYEGEMQIPSCCRSIPVLCWQHCIREVKIEHSYDGGSQPKRYSIGDEDILKKIDATCLNLKFDTGSDGYSSCSSYESNGNSSDSSWAEFY